MTDYETRKRVVYLLCHKDSDFGRDVYVGSTSQTLAQRLSNHKTDCLRIGNEENKLYVRMREVGLDKWITRPLLTLESTRDVIRTFEKMWCKIINTDLNSYDPMRSATERLQNNKDNKRFFCEVCKMTFLQKCDLKRHENSLKHQYAFLNSLD